MAIRVTVSSDGTARVVDLRKCTAGKEKPPCGPSLLTQLQLGSEMQKWGEESEEETQRPTYVLPRPSTSLVKGGLAGAVRGP